MCYLTQPMQYIYCMYLMNMAIDQASCSFIDHEARWGSAKQRLGGNPEESF